MALSYEKSGVSVTRGDDFVTSIGRLCRSTLRPSHGVLAGVGGFAALAKLPRMKDPLVVTSTDGVGTKVLLASALKSWSGVGIDLVAMSVNDILTTGAKPWLFLDYYAVGSLDAQQGRKVLEGIVEGCRQAGCALVGGETAEMPGVYATDHFDLAGFCVGLVEKKKLLTPQTVKPGQKIYALPSSGVHSNGFSLVRATLTQAKLDVHQTYKELDARRSLGDVLLTPTRIYVAEILPLLKKPGIKAMAHITGGGIDGNLVRVLPKGITARVETQRWTPPAIFKALATWGNITQSDMFETFNMGLGMMLVLDASAAKRLERSCKDAMYVGETVARRGPARVELI